MLALLQAEFIPRIPLDAWVESAVNWMTDTFGFIFGPLQVFLDTVVGALAFVLTAPPALLTIVVLAAIAYFMASWRIALFTALGLLLMISLDLWDATMFTLALILAADGCLPDIRGAFRHSRREIPEPAVIHQARPGHYADDAAVRVSGPFRRCSGYWEPAGAHSHGHLRHAARGAAHHARHTAGSQ